MDKVKTVFCCSECGFQSRKWLGKCPDCSAWNSFMESLETKKSSHAAAAVTVSPVLLDKIDSSDVTRIKSGITEFDRVLGGGIVPASVVLIGGEPGIGKSTLLLQMASVLSEKQKVLYVAGEESPQQIKSRADRLGMNGKSLLILPETSLESIISACEQINPSLVIIDSIQTVGSVGLNSAPGTASQIRECTQALVRKAKDSGLSMMIVGHVTKEGMIAGPKILEHMVDTVIYFEGERKFNFRILRTVKNRFGSTNEIGLFKMTSTGLSEVRNPSEIFLSSHEKPRPGVFVSASMEGTRPILIEIESLTSQTPFGNGRRLSQGIEVNRIFMIIAVIEKFLGLRVYDHDVYLNIVGGLRVSDPAADLAVALAVSSALKNRPARNSFAIGELSLTSEIRPVPFMEERISEAVKLGYTSIIIPDSRIERPTGSGVTLMKVSTLEEAVECAF